MRTRATRQDHVTALLVASGGEEWLVECLDALAASDRPVDRLVVVDTSPEGDALPLVEGHEGLAGAGTVVELLDPRPRADLVVAMRQALREVEPHQGDDAEGATSWWWLLHQGCAPEPGALRALLGTASGSSKVGVVAPKVVLAQDPERFVEYGITTTTTGRRSGGPRTGELDQGQHDARLDVLGAGTTGLLVRESMLRELGGLDRSGRGAEGLDLCWRAHLTGHRVLLGAKARVREHLGTPGRPGARGAHARQAMRTVALQRAPWYQAPWLWLRLLVGGLASAIVFLVLKQPGAAGRELGDLAVLPDVAGRAGARWRFRGHRQVRSAHLAALFATPGDSFRSTLDAARDAVGWDAPRAEVSAAGGLESGPVAEDAESMGSSAVPGRRTLGAPAALAVLIALVAGVLALRHVTTSSVLGGRRAGVSGGLLLPVEARATDLWSAWTDPWHGAGLGTDAPAEPWLPLGSAAARVVELVPGMGEASPLGTALAWGLLLALPAATLSAYLGGRALTRRRGVRAVGALLWAGSAPLLLAVGEGRVAPLVAHVLLPLVLAGGASAVRRRGPLWAAFAAALAAAVLGAFAPALLAVLSAAAVVAAAWAAGWARARALVLALVPWLLLGPWLGAAWHDPALLLAGPGVVGPAVASPGAELLLGHPGGGVVPALLGLPLVALALAGFLGPGRDRGARVGLALLAAGGVALAVVARRVVVGHDAGGTPLHVWAGLPLQVAVLAQWALALLAGRLVTARRGVYVPVLGIVATLALLPLGVVGLRGLGHDLAPAREAPSAAVVEAQRGGAGLRVLDLRRDGGIVLYRLTGQELGPISPVVVRPEGPGHQAEQRVERLVAGRAETAPGELAPLGVGFVRVPVADAPALAPVLDAVPGLSRLGSGTSTVTWRVQAATGDDGAVAPARLRIVDRNGAPLRDLPMAGAHGRADVDVPGGAGHRLAVAEGPSWARSVEVSVDGRPLQVTQTGGEPTVDLPDQGGRLRVAMADPERPWRLAQAAMLAVVVFLALPLGRRARRQS